MTRKKLLTASVPFIFLIILTYNNCSKTEFNTVQETVITNPHSPVANELMLAVCGVINRCNPQVSVDVCQNALLSTSGFATPLGLTSGYDTFSAIVQGEQTGALVGNSTAATGCYDNVNTLSCTNASVVNAYNASASNPFAAAAGVFSSGSCGQVYSAGVNLEVPVEMVDVGLASNTTATAFSRTSTSFNPADYDGTLTYSFEITTYNGDSLTRNVSLVNSANTVVATIAVPKSATPSYDPIRYGVTFTAPLTADVYRIQLDGTTSANQLIVYNGRLLVRQTGATMTKIFIPLTAGIARTSFSGDKTSSIDNSTTTTYTQPNPGWYSLWRKNNSAYSQLAATTPWTFEAVIGATSGATAYASLFDASTGLQVNNSEVSTASTTPALVTASFADSSPNFNDLDNFQVRFKENGGTAYLYRAGLWIKLTNLTHAEVYFRYLTSESWINGNTAGGDTYHRAVVDTSAFSAASVYNEVVSYVTSAGTSCTEALYDMGTADSGFTGTIVPNSSLTISSLTLARQRSPAVAITSGDRFVAYISANPGPGTCAPVSSFVIIGF